MKTIVKSAVALSLAGAVTLAAMTPSLARSRGWAAAGAGFVAGTVLGAAVANANANYYYGQPYAYDSYAYSPSYAYGPSYTYGPGVYASDAYAYGPTYMAPRSRHYRAPGDARSYDRERQLRGTDY